MMPSTNTRSAAPRLGESSEDAQDVRAAPPIDDAFSGDAKPWREVRHAFMASADLHDMPDAFARQFRPIRVSRHEKGLAAYVFDLYRLRFFIGMTTAEPVPPESVWSIVPAIGCRSFRIVAGQTNDALGFVLTETPRTSAAPMQWPLPRRLSYRQKVRRATLRAILKDLESVPFEVAPELRCFIENRMEE